MRQYRDRGTTSIIHGKAWHEETKATVSQAISEKGGTHYLVVFTLAETDYVCDYIRKGGNKEEFLKKFEGAYSPGFDPDQHLVSVGVANQTTMMKGETEEVQRRFEQAMVDATAARTSTMHFRKADTICGATQERQDALSEMLGVEKMNLLLVVGGYNSSNTSHLAEMGEAQCCRPTSSRIPTSSSRPRKSPTTTSTSISRRRSAATGCPRATWWSASPPAPRARTTCSRERSRSCTSSAT